MCIHICLARSLHEKSHINVYLQTRLMIYVLVAVLVFNAQYSVTKTSFFLPNKDKIPDSCKANVVLPWMRSFLYWQN